MNAKEKKRIALVLVVTLLVCVSPTLAYPPDNAAVLYYKAFRLYQPKDEIKSMLHDYRQGRIELNETLEQYFAANQRVIDMVLDATRIEKCDWGLDYSQGAEVLLPPHHEARNIVFLIAAEAAMQADQGHPREALERCLSLYRMARHLNERPLICYLVGVAINALSHKCVTQCLSEMPPETETLTWLLAELAKLDEQPYAIAPVLDWKHEAGRISMSPEKVRNVAQTGLDDGDIKRQILERLRTADSPFYTKNIAYWNDFMDRIQAAFDMPYAKAYPELQRLGKKPFDEFETNQDATLTTCLAPNFLRIYVLALRLETQSNALRTAIGIYLATAQSGRLPEVLPTGSPNDPYTGKPFQYERTDEGFVLRCRVKDLDKDEAYEFKYKVTK